MVVVTEKELVRKVGRTAPRPGNYVVRIRPVGRPVAPGEPAAPISDSQAPPTRR